jgi:hypothetical protein
MSQIQSGRPATDCVAIVSGVVFTQCAAINASAACTADITFASGRTVTGYALTAGINPVQATKVANISTGSLWALYNEV